MTSQPVLIAESIKKIFSSSPPISILSGISLTAHHGDSIAITGRSGSGKSTLLHILAALDAPTSGSITLCNKVVTEKNSPRIRNQHVGFIFQSFHLLEDFSLIDNILMPGKIARKPTAKGSSLYNHALTLLEKVGLENKKDTAVKVLSGGEKQRACLARALCLSPDILFADEPTGNLDAFHAEKVASLLFDLVKEEGKTLILVTHDADLALRCDKTFQLKDGFLHPS